MYSNELFIGEIGGEHRGLYLFLNITSQQLLVKQGNNRVVCVFNLRDGYFETNSTIELSIDFKEVDINFTYEDILKIMLNISKSFGVLIIFRIDSTNSLELICNTFENYNIYVGYNNSSRDILNINHIKMIENSNKVNSVVLTWRGNL